MTQVVVEKALVSAKDGFAGVINQKSVVGGRDFVFVNKADPTIGRQIALGTRQMLDLTFPEQANDDDYAAFLAANANLKDKTALEQAKAYLASLTKKPSAKAEG